MNFIFIHSTGGNPDECFYPWLKEKLKGEVIAPSFPTPEWQSLESWLAAFEPYWKYVNEETVFIGRSIGPAFILRLLERSKKKVKACFLVAGFVSDIGNDFGPLVESFIEEDFDWEKIKKNCERFFVYHGDDDPIVLLAKGKELAEKLGAELVVVKGKQHITQEEFPEILEGINILNNN